MRSILVSMPPTSDHRVRTPENIAASCKDVISRRGLVKSTTTAIPSHAIGVATRSGSVSPTTAVFGFKIDSEWSDPTRNNQTADQQHGCPGPCGHHIRFWPLRDRNGQLVPNTYLISMDYAGINYDYNDNC